MEDHWRQNRIVPQYSECFVLAVVMILSPANLTSYTPACDSDMLAMVMQCCVKFAVVVFVAANIASQWL